MDNFKFKLQKVLDYKAKLEEEKKEEFVEAQKRLLCEKKLLEELIYIKKEAQNRKFNFKHSYDFQNHARYLDHLDDKIENQKEVITAAKAQYEIKKDELIKLTSDRKVIEKLKDKARQEFEFEQNRIEQKQNDDFALFGYIRSERG